MCSDKRLKRKMDRTMNKIHSLEDGADLASIAYNSEAPPNLVRSFIQKRKRKGLKRKRNRYLGTRKRFKDSEGRRERILVKEQSRYRKFKKQRRSLYTQIESN